VLLLLKWFEFQNTFYYKMITNSKYVKVRE
jgi:hypothetical protein